VAEVEHPAVAVTIDPGAIVVGVPESDSLASTHDRVESKGFERADLPGVAVYSARQRTDPVAT
jgi:hypothetical protein